MTVYVDDMKIKYQGMYMCHMIADSRLELFKMTTEIGVKIKWYHKGHFNICIAKRRLAIKKGAILVPKELLAKMHAIRKVTTGIESDEPLFYGTPEEIHEKWMNTFMSLEKPQDAAQKLRNRLAQPIFYVDSATRPG